MWCIPKLTPEFIERMEDVLDLYAKPYNKKEPVLCFDEKSKELHEDARPYQKTKQHTLRRRDYEYVRKGTQNIFVTVEPKGGYRNVHMTARRTRTDFAHEIKRITSLSRYRIAQTIHIVLDNLNTHYEKSLIATFGEQQTAELMRRIHFHHTPKHASWLNMAEIEIGVASTQAIKGRFPTAETLRTQLRAWQKRRNRQQSMINWTFTKRNARKKFRYVGVKLC